MLHKSGFNRDTDPSWPRIKLNEVARPVALDGDLWRRIESEAHRRKMPADKYLAELLDGIVPQTCRGCGLAWHVSGELCDMCNKHVRGDGKKKGFKR